MCRTTSLGASYMRVIFGSQVVLVSSSPTILPQPPCTAYQRCTSRSPRHSYTIYETYKLHSVAIVTSGMIWLGLLRIFVFCSTGIPRSIGSFMSGYYTVWCFPYALPLLLMYIWLPFSFDNKERTPILTERWWLNQPRGWLSAVMSVTVL